MEGVGYWKAQVKPRMRFGQYDTFAVLSLSEDSVDRVVGALCQCTAGLSYSCIHIAALLISFSHLAEASVTSMPCRWIQPSSSGANSAAFLAELNFGKVSQAHEWKGPTADVDCLAAAIGEADIETSWISFRQIERDTLKRQASTTPLAQIEDPLVRLKKWTGERI